jgi:hypothetical protein
VVFGTYASARGVGGYNGVGDVRAGDTQVSIITFLDNYRLPRKKISIRDVAEQRFGDAVASVVQNYDFHEVRSNVANIAGIDQVCNTITFHTSEIGTSFNLQASKPILEV